MHFRIAETFTGSLARLTGEEQKAVKTTAFDLQMNPASPGLSFHKLDKARDKHFWSVRVSADIRIIVHRTDGNLLLAYVDHHDKAYAWAERRRIETHPATGAAQIVETRELVREIVVPTYVQREEPAPAVAPEPVAACAATAPLFAGLTDEALLGHGVPAEWLEEVRTATEDSLFAVAEHLPAEAAEALLELATGGVPRTPRPALPADDAFDHPDARRRFQLVRTAEELKQALEFPWDKWTVFLHPDQRELVERSLGGPARVSGSAGTGKTIVALHRAVHLARRDPEARVLLATFSEPLARALHARLRRLVAHQPRLADRIDVGTLDAAALRIYRAHAGTVAVIQRGALRQLIRETAQGVPGHAFGMRFLLAEWDQVVDQWHVTSWEAYRDVPRIGRKARLSEAQRKTLWTIFERVRDELQRRSLTTHAGVMTVLASLMAAADNLPYDHVVVDEAQDISVSQLRFVAALGAGRPDALFFAGDLGQQIFQPPFSWRALDVDVRGRSFTLRVNYRTSHQIRAHADRLLASEISDADGNRVTRADTVSVINGAPPDIRTLSSVDDEIAAVGAWLIEREGEGVEPHELAVFVRSEEQFDRARAAVEASGLPFKVLDDRVETTSGRVCVGQMHIAKGLEFRGVVVMACDDEIIPLEARLDTAGEEADLEEIYDTERHLLYVACTRAREFLLVTSGGNPSEFIDDLRAC